MWICEQHRYRFCSGCLLSHLLSYLPMSFVTESQFINRKKGENHYGPVFPRKHLQSPNLDIFSLLARSYTATDFASASCLRNDFPE